MMRLSLMHDYFRTADERLASPLVDGFAALWGAEPGSAALLRASANLACTFLRGGERYLLRVSPPGGWAEEALEAELDFLGHLRARDLPVQLPLPSFACRRVERVEGPQGPCLAVAFGFLPGATRDAEELDDPRLEAWGRSLGLLHAAAESFEGGTARGDWRDAFDRALADLGRGEAEILGKATELRRRLEALPARTGPGGDFGPCHMDFEPDNLVWEDGPEPGAMPAIIDFHETFACWFAADLAFAVRDLAGDCAADFDPRAPRLATFLRGYRDVRPFPEAELGHMPLFLALSHFLHYAETEAILAEPPSVGEEPWVPGIRDRLRAHRARWLRGIDAALALPSP